MISAVKAGESSLDTETRLRTPAGSPASWNSSATMNWLRGLNSEDLSTTVFPQRMGTAIARSAGTTGAFHGAMLKLADKGAHVSRTNINHPRTIYMTPIALL